MKTTRHSALAFALLIMGRDLALAHAGEPMQPHDIWTFAAWSFEPWVVIPLALSAWLYWRGARPLWRGEVPGRGIRRWEAACFAVGWLGLVLALVSPLHQMGSVLFSAHMAQHEVLMIIAAPLLVLGRPLVPFLWGLPAGWRRALGDLWTGSRILRSSWHVLTEPLVIWSLHAVALWIWHVPGFFEATLQSEFIHTLQHASFFVSALLFWWALIYGRHARMGYGAAVLFVFTTAVHSSILGALLVFTRTVWYPAYSPFTLVWGLTPLEDQQLAGLIMWVPAGVLYMLAGLALFAGWLREAERRIAAAERERALEQG